MKVAAIAATLTTLLSVAFAAPAEPLFSIKTVSSDPRFNGLCLSSYHTGAGTADAVLGACSKNTTANKVYYQEGKAIYTTTYDEAGSSSHGSIQAAIGISYNQWYPVTIDIVEGPTKDFVYSTTNGFTVEQTGYGDVGFIVCRWAHYGVPQLFLLAQAEDATTKLANCGFVKLFKN